MVRYKAWEGQDLEGLWSASIKIDGVQANFTEDGVVSKHGKPLHNLDHIKGVKQAEIYFGSWEESVSAVRTIGADPVPTEMVYSLDPIDRRLSLGCVKNPRAADINTIMKRVVSQGYEGLVLRKRDLCLKVKPFETYDVKVTSMNPGKGKYEGTLGALVTPMGNVGTGMTDKVREELWKLTPPFVVEVKCMQLTKAGKFRHPRFIRVRWDKDADKC